MSYKEHKDLVLQCRQIVIRHASDYRAFFKRMDDLLFQLAHDADDDAERNAYFFSMRQLRAHETQFIESMIERVLIGFDVYWINSSPADPPIKLNRRDVDDEYSALHYRFSYLLGHVVPTDKHPLSVDLIRTYFKQSLARFVNIEDSIKTLAYQQFNHTVVVYAEQMYHHLNQHLIEQKILTNLKYKHVKPLNSASPIEEVIKPATDDDDTITPETRLAQMHVKNRFIRSDIEPNKTVQFAWHSALTGRYVFNDRQGEPVLDVSHTELLDLFKQGALTPVAKPTKKTT